MKCPNCGTTSRIREKDNFCHNCGCNLHLGKIKEAVKEVLQGDEIETIEEWYITGERKISVQLNGKELYSVVPNENSKESVKLEDELEKLCKPVVEWLERNVHPHALICITTDRIELLESTVGIPVKNG